MSESWSPVEQTLARLVSWDTVSHRPLDAMAGWLADRAEAAGMSVERFESEPGKVNVVATAGPDTAGGLGLSGHMDVVPVDGQDWTTDPFRLTSRDGRLLGRGTCDMKGFIAASVEALATMNLSKLRRPLVLVWTHDEEVGCQGSAHLVAKMKALGRTLPKAMIVGEPTGFQVANIHPGHSSIRIACSGRPAHSSRPSLGLSAITLAAEVLGVLDGLAEDLKQTRAFEDVLPSPFTVMNVARISGGEAINIVPAQCVIEVGFRPLPGVRFGTIRASLMERLAPAIQRARYQGGDITVADIQRSEGLCTAPDAGHAHLLHSHATTDDLIGVPFATDAGNLAELDCHPLIFGPGSIDVAHRADEWLDRSDLARTVDIVQDLVYRRCIAA